MTKDDVIKKERKKIIIKFGFHHILRKYGSENDLISNHKSARESHVRDSNKANACDVGHFLKTKLLLVV